MATDAPTPWNPISASSLPWAPLPVQTQRAPTGECLGQGCSWPQWVLGGGPVCILQKMRNSSASVTILELLGAAPCSPSELCYLGAKVGSVLVPWPGGSSPGETPHQAKDAKRHQGWCPRQGGRHPPGCPGCSQRDRSLSSRHARAVMGQGGRASFLSEAEGAEHVQFSEDSVLET